MPKRVIEIEVLMNARQAKAETIALNEQMALFQRNMERTGRGALAGTVAISGMGRAIAFASSQFLAGYGLLYAFTTTMKSAIQFQQAMVLIQTQAGGTAVEVANMTKGVLALAPAVGTTPLTLAKGLYHVESSGIRGAAALRTLKIAAEGAKLGGADLESVVNGLVGAEISGIKGTKDLASTMGVLDAIVGSGNLRMEDLAKALSSGIVPTAKAFGLGLVDIGSALSTLTVHGIPAVMAANRLRTALNFLAAGTPAAEKALANIGLTTHRIGETMRSQGLVPALELISEHLRRSGLDATEQVQVIARAFGGARSSSTFLIMLKYLSQLQDHVRQVGLAAGTFGQKWAAEQKTAQFAADKMKASVSTLADKMGLAMLPAVSKVANSMSNWLSKSENQKRIQDDLTQAIKVTEMVLRPFVQLIFGFTKAVGGVVHAVELLIGFKVAKTFLAWGDSALIAAQKMKILANAEAQAGFAGAAAFAGGPAAAARMRAGSNGGAMLPGAAMAAYGLSRTGNVNPLLTEAAQREAAIARAGQGGRYVSGGVSSANPLLFVPPNIANIRSGVTSGGQQVELGARRTEIALGRVERATQAATRSFALMSGALAKLSVGKIFTVVIVAQILESFVSQSTKDTGQHALDRMGHNFAPGADIAPKLGHLPIIGPLFQGAAGFGYNKGEDWFGKPPVEGFPGHPAFGSDAVNAFVHSHPGWAFDGKKFYRVDWLANVPRFHHHNANDPTNSIVDLVNPRIGIPGSGAQPDGSATWLHAGFFEATKTSKMALDLAKARLAVARGDEGANKLLVAALRHQVAVDVASYKAQERAMLAGKGSATKHAVAMAKIAQDETAALAEIKSVQAAASKKTWQLPMALQVSQAWAENTDAITGGDAASRAVAAQIIATTQKQIRSGKLHGDDLVAAINAMTTAQQVLATYNVPVKLALKQAWAATTVTTKDDIAVAQQLYDVIMKQIHSGKFKGKALLDLIGQLPGLLNTIKNNFQLPMKITLGMAKATTTLSTSDDKKWAKASLDFANAYLKSKKKTAEGMLAAYGVIDQANSILGTATQQTAYTMASTHKLTAGLGLTRAQRIAQEQRIAQMEAHGGRVPKGGWLGVMGFAVNGNASVRGPRGAGPNAVTVHTPNVTIHAGKVVGGGSGSVIININGGNPAQVERAVLKALQKKRGYSAPQRRGANGGHVLGAD